MTEHDPNADPLHYFGDESDTLKTIRANLERLERLKTGPVGVNGPEPALCRAIREELLNTLEQPLNLATLQNLSRIAGAATALVTQQRMRNGNGIVIGEYGSYDSSMLPMTPMQSSGSENFGMTWMRELVGALREFNKPREPVALPEPSDTVYTMTLAIQNAKNLGLLDVAAKLTEQLRDKLREPKAVEAPPAPAEDPEETPAGPTAICASISEAPGAANSSCTSPRPPKRRRLSRSSSSVARGAGAKAPSI